MFISKNTLPSLKLKEKVDSVEIASRLVQSCSKQKVKRKDFQDDVLAKGTQLTKKSFLRMKSVSDKSKVRGNAVNSNHKNLNDFNC